MNESSKKAKHSCHQNANFYMITWKLIALVNIVCNIDRTGVLSHHYFHITTRDEP